MLTPLSTDGYHYYTSPDSPEGPGSLVREDGDTLLPPYEGTYTILEECESEVVAEACARAWSAHSSSFVTTVCHLIAERRTEMKNPLTRTEQIQILRDAIKASGLSARRFAVEVMIRDERTVRRWLAGDSPIPRVVLDRLIEEMTVVCAWCGRSIGTQPGSGVSHGICTECAVEFEASHLDIPVQ